MSRSRWTPSAARRTTPTCRPSRVASGGAWPSPGSCSGTPTCSCSTSRPTTSTRSRWSGSSASSRSTAGTVVAVTHDRYFLDNVGTVDPRARPGSRDPVPGQLLGVARTEARAAARRSRSRPTRGRARWHGSSSGSASRPGRARRRARRVSTAYEQLLEEAQGDKGNARQLEIAIPPGPRLGDQVIEVANLRKAYGDRLLIEDLTFALPRAGIVGDHRPQRRRQDDPVPDAGGGGAAGRRDDHDR